MSVTQTRMYAHTNDLCCSFVPGPRSVSGLTEAGITPTDVTLIWDQPENKAGYSFKVEVTYPNGSLLIGVTVNNTKIIVTGLQSGSNYTFTVTTLTEDGTMATPVKVSYYTSMFPLAITILIFILRVIYLSNLVLIRVHIWDQHMLNSIPPLFMTQVKPKTLCFQDHIPLVGCWRLQ